MKQIITSYSTPEVAQPLPYSNMAFLESGIQEIVYNTAKGLIEQNLGSFSDSTPYVLWGLQVTAGSSYTWNAGSILYNKIIYYSPTQSISATSSYSATFSNIYPSYANPVLFSDGVTSYNVCQDTQIQIITGNSGLFDAVNGLVYLEPIGTELNGLLNNLTVGNWQSVTLSGTWATYSSSTIRYKRDGVNFVNTYDVQLQGVIQNPNNPLSSPGTSTTMFTLPAGFRPSQELYFNCPCLQSGLSGYSTIVSVTTAGVVGFAAPGTTGSISFLDLSPIRFTTL